MYVCKTDQPKYYPFLACRGGDSQCAQVTFEEIDYDPAHRSRTYRLTIQFNRGTLAFSKDDVMLWYYLTFGKWGCRVDYIRRINVKWNARIALGGYTYTKEIKLTSRTCVPGDPKMISVGLYHYPLMGSLLRPRSRYYGFGCDMEMKLTKQPGSFNIYYVKICVPTKYGIKIPDSIVRIILEDGTILNRLGWADKAEIIQDEEMICFRVDISRWKLGLEEWEATSKKFKAHVIIPMKK